MNSWTRLHENPVQVADGESKNVDQSLTGPERGSAASSRSPWASEEPRPESQSLCSANMNISIYTYVCLHGNHIHVYTYLCIYMHIL